MSEYTDPFDEEAGEQIDEALQRRAEAFDKEVFVPDADVGATLVDDEVPPEPPPDVPVLEETYLPPDIAEVWNKGPFDLISARTLVAAWGEEGFRSSNLHQLALAEQSRSAEADVVRTAFKKAREKKK